MSDESHAAPPAASPHATSPDAASPHATSPDAASPHAASPDAALPSRPPWLRTGLGGVLMGLANLVPGVSGGTMVLVMGLYDEFVSSVAEVTQFRFSRRNVAFLAVLGGAAAAAVVTLSGPTKTLVTTHRSAMYSLFIGMTLGGVPLLIGMMRPVRARAIVGLGLGLALMLGIALGGRDAPEHAGGGTAAPGAGTAAAVQTDRAYARDALAGVLGMSAMVLPGISGAYMLLLLGRYEAILASIDRLKSYATSGGSAGGLDALHVIIPVAIGAILSLVVVSNVLKWALRHHERLMVGILLGILLGSVVGIWPFDPAYLEGAAGAAPTIVTTIATTTATATVGAPAGYVLADYLIGAGLAAAGFLLTAALGRINE